MDSRLPGQSPNTSPSHTTAQSRRSPTMHPPVLPAEGATSPPHPEPRTATINIRPLTHDLPTSIQAQQPQQPQQPQHSDLQHNIAQHSPSIPTASASTPTLPHRITTPPQHMHQLPQPHERPTAGTTPHIVPFPGGIKVGAGEPDMDNSTARRNLVQQILTFTTLGWEIDAIATHLKTTGWADVDAEMVRRIWGKYRPQGQ